jgi:cytoskeleton protein RodZ
MSELPNDEVAAAAAPPPAPAEPVGTVLARAREAAGIALEEAARQLKFAPRQLDALERGEWGRLPGGAAVRSMVRKYAQLLELDAGALVARVGEGQSLPDADRLAQRLRQPVPFSDGSRRSNVVYVVLSIVLLAVVAAVVLEWREDSAGASRLSFVSAAQQPAEPARQEPQRVQRIELASAAPQPGAAPQASAPPAAAAPVDDEQRVASGEWRRIELRFERESWVEITSGTGKLLVSHLHPAGSERVVVGVPPFSVVIGNAQHVKLAYNDQPVDLMPHVKVEVARLTLQ